MLHGSVLKAVRRLGVAGAGAAVLAVLSLPNAAWATTNYFSNVTVSCQNGIYTDVLNFLQSSTGTVTVHQTSTSPQITSAFHLQSSLGNNTTAKVAGDGTSVDWTSVLPADYKTWQMAGTSVNCNGIGFGDGNSQIYGWVSHT